MNQKTQKIRLPSFLIILSFFACLSTGCQSGGNSSNAPTKTEDGGNGDFSSDMKDVKQDILGLVEGTYSVSCTKMINDELQMPGTGSPFHILSFTGDANWGFGSINLLSNPSTDFGVVVDHQRTQMGSKFDMVDARTMARMAVLAVAVYDENTIAATVTDERGNPKLSDLCGGSQLPKGIGADLWSITNKYYSGSVSSMNCFNAQTAQQFKWNFSMTPQKIVLGPHTISSDSARKSEALNVTDFEPQEGINYQIVTPDDNQFSLFLTQQKKLRTIQWIDDNQKLIGCNPPN